MGIKDAWLMRSSARSIPTTPKDILNLWRGERQDNEDNWILGEGIIEYYRKEEDWNALLPYIIVGSQFVWCFDDSIERITVIAVEEDNKKYFKIINNANGCISAQLYELLKESPMNIKVKIKVQELKEELYNPLWPFFFN
jgi:hypothetical protein